VRVPIGIGHPGHRERVVGYVMHDFGKADYDWLEPLLAAIADAAPHLTDGANDRFQTQVAHQTQGEEPESKKAKPSPPAKKQKLAAPKEKQDEKPAQDGPLAAKLRRWLGS
jgi:PTH1 family peptidyl-tRNA hydrolase